jgi:hypothetical protein
LPPHFGEARIGIVFAQLQAELGPAGEHAVRLSHALGHQVVHQHAQISLIACRCPGGFAPALQRGVDAGKQTLGCRLFIPGGAVDLTRKKQAVDLLRLKTVLQ